MACTVAKLNVANLCLRHGLKCNNVSCSRKNRVAGWAGEEDLCSHGLSSLTGKAKNSQVERASTSFLVPSLELLSDQ